MSKTLIFGGAFDPPHREHANMCKAAMRELGIDRLIVVPTYLPPHKSAGFLSFECRCELIRAAFADIGFEIDDIENQRKTDNYSAYVLPLLKKKYGDIVYLIGGDSLERLDTWYKPYDVINCCPIAVCTREGYGNISEQIDRLKSKYGGSFTELKYRGKNISSSLTRAKLLLGDGAEEVVPEVLSLIRKNGLFKDYAPYVKKLRTYQTPDLFEHSKAVVRTAVYLNSKHNLRLDFEKVFTAALLHDNAKQRPSVDGLPVPSDSIGTPVLHQFLGAEKARRDFGVTDEEVLAAIRCHTTAKADMTLLEKLIYTADSVSDDRDYSPIPTLRRIAYENFDDGFRAVLDYTYQKVSAKGGSMYPLTKQAVEFYLGTK